MSTVTLARRSSTMGAAALALALMGGCAEDDADPVLAPPTQLATPSATVSATPAPVTGSLTILAAASLTEVFTRLGESFKAANPGVTIRFSFGASSALAQQVVAKAPADVFAAASPATMATVTAAGGAASTPVIFARNELQIATPKDNPAGITGLSDFSKSALRIVVCAQVVPCGAAAQQVFTAAGLSASIDSYEQDVKGVLTKVSTGEADAGLVYRTDVKAAGERVVGISFPESADAINDYPIAVLSEARNPSAAAAWVAFLAGDTAKAALQEAGFRTP